MPEHADLIVTNGRILTMDSDADVFRAGMAYEKAVGGWYGDGARRPKL